MDQAKANNKQRRLRHVHMATAVFYFLAGMASLFVAFWLAAEFVFVKCRPPLETPLLTRTLVPTSIGVFGLALCGRGLWLGFRAYHSFVRARHLARNECTRCGYSLKGRKSEMCPECGQIVEESDPSRGTMNI